MRLNLAQTGDATTRDKNDNNNIVREYYSNNEKVATYSNQFDKDGNAVNFQVKFEKRSKKCMKTALIFTFKVLFFYSLVAQKLCVPEAKKEYRFSNKIVRKYLNNSKSRSSDDIEVQVDGNITSIIKHEDANKRRFLITTFLGEIMSYKSYLNGKIDGLAFGFEFFPDSSGKVTLVSMAISKYSLENILYHTSYERINNKFYKTSYSSVNKDDSTFVFKEYFMNQCISRERKIKYKYGLDNGSYRYVLAEKRFSDRGELLLDTLYERPILFNPLLEIKR